MKNRIDHYINLKELFDYIDYYVEECINSLESEPLLKKRDYSYQELKNYISGFATGLKRGIEEW